MKNMSLEKIAQACGGVYHGSEEMKQSIVESITTDSRQAAKGCLFVAIPGERVDGHDFIPSVFEKGALAVLSEKSWKTRQDRTFRLHLLWRQSKGSPSTTGSSSISK